MKKEKHNLKATILIFFVLALISAFLLYFGPELTGLIVYEQISNEWNFSSENDYNFDENEITLQNNKAELKATTTLENNTVIEYRTSYLKEATYDDDDKLEKLNTIDDEKVNVKEDEKLNIKFNNSIDNNDKINLHIVDTNFDRTIHVCNYDEDCDAPGYGNFNYTSDMGDGVYSITLIGLSSNLDSFRIKTSDKVKIDYIDATYLFLEFNETEITTYPLTSTIETNDLNLGIAEIANVIFDYLGEINFKFSTDSGNNWINIENNISIDLEGEDNIRFMATLNYNENLLPVLNKITLNYDVCNVDWQCSEWSECTENGIENRTCLDLNQCNTLINKPEEIKSCIYFSDYYEIDKSKLLAIKKDTLTQLNASKAVIDLMINQDINSTNITLNEYNKTDKNITELNPLGRFLDLSVSNDVNKNLNYSIIKLYYTEQDLITNNLDENSLKLYYYNETNRTWEKLNSNINEEEDYVYATIYHFSTYGIFGQEVKRESKTSSPGGGGDSKDEVVKKRRPIIEKAGEEEKDEGLIITEEEIKPKEVVEVKDIAEEPKEGIFDFLTSKAIYIGGNLKSFYKENVMFFIALLVSILIYFVFRILHIKRRLP